jgi:hypothetical protein
MCDPWRTCEASNKAGNNEGLLGRGGSTFVF